MGGDGNARAQKVFEGRRWVGMVMQGRRRFFHGVLIFFFSYLFRIRSPGNSLLWERGQGPHQPVQGRGSQASRIGQPFKFEP